MSATMFALLGCGEPEAPPPASAEPVDVLVPPATAFEALDRAPQLRPPAAVFVGHPLLGGRFSMSTAYTGPTLPVTAGRCVRPSALPATLRHASVTLVLDDEQRAGHIVGDGCVRRGELTISVQTDALEDGYLEGIVVADRPVVPAARFVPYFDNVVYDDALRVSLTAAVRPSLPPAMAQLVDETPLVPVVHEIRVADDCPRIAIVDTALDPSTRRPNPHQVVAAVYCLGPTNDLRGPIVAPIPGLRAILRGAVDLDGDGLQTLVFEVAVSPYDADVWDWIIERDASSSGFVELGSGRRTDLPIPYRTAR